MIPAEYSNIDRFKETLRQWLGEDALEVATPAKEIEIKKLEEYAGDLQLPLLYLEFQKHFGGAEAPVYVGRDRNCAASSVLRYHNQFRRRTSQQPKRYKRPMLPPRCVLISSPGMADKLAFFYSEEVAEPSVVRIDGDTIFGGQFH